MHNDLYTKKVIELVSQGRSFFITGKAGTGKTTMLADIVEDSQHRRRVAVVAPTGVAAKNAGGVTIHSFLRLPISVYIPGYKHSDLYRLNQNEIDAIKMIDMIIIDEVSMVRCDMLDMVDDVLRHYRGNDLPFGGVQMILMGDLFQLMPVAQDEDKEKLDKHYKTTYFFSSRVLEKMSMPILELTKVHRQKDPIFIGMLNEIREGKFSSISETMLMKRYIRGYVPDDNDGYIKLTTHNYKAKGTNKYKLEELPGTGIEYKSRSDGWTPDLKVWPINYVIKLKIGARVMFVRNSSNGDFINGTLGTVTYLDSDNIIVRTDEGKTVYVEKFRWTYYNYRLNPITKELETNPIGWIENYPIKLAWTITIHKSQGLTFDKVVIDAGKAFTSGQVYVALSRCRSLEGIILSSKIKRENVMIDKDVLEYLKQAEKITVEDVQSNHTPEQIKPGQVGYLRTSAPCRGRSKAFFGDHCMIQKDMDGVYIYIKGKGHFFLTNIQRPDVVDDWVFLPREKKDVVFCYLQEQYTDYVYGSLSWIRSENAIVYKDRISQKEYRFQL